MFSMKEQAFSENNLSAKEKKTLATVFEETIKLPEFDMHIALVVQLREFKAIILDFINFSHWCF